MSTRAAVALELLEGFRDLGYDGLSLSEISARTKLGKSSLYHHFPGGKEEMARAVLELAEAWMRTAIVEPLAEGGAARARVDGVLDAIDGFYEGGERACILGRFASGGAREPLQRELRALFRMWIDALAHALVDGGVAKAEATARAEDAVIRIQGALVVSAGLGDTAPFARTLKELRASLVTPRARSATPVTSRVRAAPLERATAKKRARPRG